MEWSFLLPGVVTGAALGFGMKAFSYACSKFVQNSAPLPSAELPRSPQDWYAGVWKKKQIPSPFPSTDSVFARIFAGEGIRTSSVLGMAGNAIRHADGSYSKCYHVHLPESFYESDLDLSRKLDALTRVITADLPKDSILSFRYSVAPDSGSVIDSHQERQYPAASCYQPARAYHDASVSFYRDLAGYGFFKRSNTLLWIRIPSSDKGALTNPLSWIGDGFKWTKSDTGKKVEHEEIRNFEIQRERDALRRASKYFNRIENLLTAPVRISGLSQSETFAALYLSHNLDARSVPNIPTESLIDLRPYLGGETIEFRDWYALHGQTPVAVVTLFVPPQPAVPNDFARLWTQNSASFRHVVITEYLTNDPGMSKRSLDKRINQLRISGRRLNGAYELTAEAKASLEQLGTVRDALAQPGSALTRMRVSVLIYGTPISDRENKADVHKNLEQLRERCEEVIRWIRTVSGAEAAIEDKVALVALYERFLLGESLPADTGREIMEVGSSLSPFIPGDSAWPGSRRPISILSTRSGRLIGLNLFDRELCPTPLCMVLGAPRSGKSAFMGRCILDTLSELPDAHAIAADFGESFGPMVDILGGRHMRFVPNSGETINIWDYEGLEQGVAPDDVQIELVLGEMLRLARIQPHSEHGVDDEKILKHAIRIVYDYIVPMNGTGGAKYEPLLSNLVSILDNYQDDNPVLVNRAARLRTILEDYVNQPLLNSPTSERFRTRSRFDVYELDSLNQFSRDEAVALAYRVAARMVQTIGKKQPDGSHAPTLLVFDEVHKIVSEFPEMVTPMRKGARQGGKHNVVTLFATHNYEDVAPVHDLLKNAGTRVIAQLASEFRGLATDLDFTPAMVDAVKSLTVKPGHFSQYAYLVGNGPDQKFEVIQLNLSPIELWQTANPDLINARARVQKLRPDWSFLDVVLFLAGRFPSGISADQVHDLQDRAIPIEPPSQVFPK